MRIATSAATAALAFATAATAAPPPEHQTSFSLVHRDGCNELPGKCYGGGTRLELAVPSGSGQWIFSLGKFRTGNAHFDVSKGIDGKMGTIALNANGQLDAAGFAATIDRTFVGDSFGAGVGIYAAHAKAHGRAEASASATLKAQPDYVLNIPAINLGPVTSPARTITIPFPERSVSTSTSDEKDAMGAYGGFRGNVRYGHAFSNHVAGGSLAAGVTVHGVVGADVTRLGTGAELLWSSAPDARLASRPGGPFSGTQLTSTARYAFGVGVWREQDTRNEIYAAEKRFAQRVVNRYEGEIGKLQARADQALANLNDNMPDELRSRVSVPSTVDLKSYAPSLTATQLLESLQVYDPKKPRYSISFRGVARLSESAHISVTILKPVGTPKTGTRVEAAASYDF